MRAKQWPPWEVASLRQKLDVLANLVEIHPKTEASEEIVGWLSRLLVVRSSGYLEQVVFEVARAFVEERSGGMVKAFAQSWLARSRNPSPENLEQLVGRFDSQLSDELKEISSTEDDGRLRRELSSWLTAATESLMASMRGSVAAGR